MNLSTEDFKGLVNSDVRDLLDEETSRRLREDVPEKWHDALLVLKRNAESQLAGDRAERSEKQAEFMKRGEQGKAEWRTYLAGRDRWRSKTIRFKNGVEDKLSEAKRVISRLPRDPSVLIQQRNAAIKEANDLRAAIIFHRDSMKAQDMIPDKWDTELWFHLGGEG